MKTLYENLNDGAFVVTKNEKGELLLGFYHDVLSIDTIERIFEPIAPVDYFSVEDIMEYIKQAK
jgi:hypothetical protein